MVHLLLLYQFTIIEPKNEKKSFMVEKIAILNI